MFALTPGFFNASPEGCYAEFVAADADWVARVPDNLPLEQARKLHELLRCRLMHCSWGIQCALDCVPDSLALEQVRCCRPYDWRHSCG